MNLEMNHVKDRDAGLALSFLLLIIWLVMRSPGLVYAAMCVLLLTMIWPPFMRPFAWLWFGLSIVLGKVVSTILISLIWLIFVVPVGTIRRLSGKDPLILGSWRKNQESCFVTRNHTYTAEDLKHPY